MSRTQSLQADSNGINLGGFKPCSVLVLISGGENALWVVFRCFRSLSPFKFFSVILLKRATRSDCKISKQAVTSRQRLPESTCLIPLTGNCQNCRQLPDEPEQDFNNLLLWSHFTSIQTFASAACARVTNMRFGWA